MFRDLADVFEGREPEAPPTLGRVVEVMRQHARRLCDWFDEPFAMRSFRKHSTWYIKGFCDETALRQKLLRIETLAELESVLDTVNPAEQYPRDSLRTPRGKSGLPQKVALPEGYLDNLNDDTPPGLEAEDPASGG